MLLQGAEIQDSGLVGREYDFDWVESALIGRGHLLWELLDECTYEAMHHSVNWVILLSVAIDLIAHDDTPMLLESVALSLEVALSFIEGVVLLLLGAIAVDNFILVVTIYGLLQVSSLFIINNSRDVSSLGGSMRGRRLILVGEGRLDG